MFFSGYMSSIHGNAFFKHRVIYTRTCYEHTHTPSRACVWVIENIEWVSERYVCSRWSFELWWRLIRVRHGSIEPCTMYLYVHTQDKKLQLITYIIYLHSCLSLRIREDCFIVFTNNWLLTLHHHMFYIALCSPTYWLLDYGLMWCLLSFGNVFVHVHNTSICMQTMVVWFTLKWCDNSCVFDTSLTTVSTTPCLSSCTVIVNPLWSFIK